MIILTNLMCVYVTSIDNIKFKKCEKISNSTDIISFDKYLFSISDSFSKHYRRKQREFKLRYNIYPHYYIFSQEKNILNPLLLDLRILNTTSKDILHFCVKKNDIDEHTSLARCLLNFNYTKISNDLFKKMLLESIYDTTNFRFLKDELHTDSIKACLTGVVVDL